MHKLSLNCCDIQSKDLQGSPANKRHTILDRRLHFDGLKKFIDYSWGIHIMLSCEF